MPEVETIRKELEEKVKNKKILDIEIRLAKLLKNSSVEDFKKKVSSTSIEDIKRRAKLLIIELSNKQSLLIHLKLTGRLLYTNPNEPVDKHTHLIFNLNDGHQLRFWDLRQFGYIKLVESGKLDEIPELKEFGPEAFGMYLENFKALLVKKRTGKIKTLLMDQSFIAGIGNIYADEALFYAKIHPSRNINTLSESEITLLHKGAQKVLTAALSKRGSSVDAYVDIYGKPGEYVPY
ncbi:MAG: DNA-formamidopyrimidine glycosylase, partial [Candidatus Subteraquimicrobiales bacterium]|nr:DNA-formamidopyrimidine glycosylase [Candidatus Subteraquimicrobiales bacterium]